MESSANILRNALICRVCLQSYADDNFLDLDAIYDEEEGLTYSNCFLACTQINLEDEPVFPCRLCKDCGLELQMAYDFQKKVLISNKILGNVVLIENEDADDNNDTYSQDATPVKVESVLKEPVSEDTNNFHFNEKSAELRKRENSYAWEEDSIDLGDAETSQDASEPESFSSLNHLEENEKEDYIKRNSSKEKTITCDICNKMFSSRYIRRHMQIHDPKRLKLECPDCMKIFYSNSSLKVHSRAHKHEGFLCPVCSKFFHIKGDMKIHLRFHTKEFPYICEFCGKTFAVRSHLRTHMSAKHKGLRLSCNECGRLFQNERSQKLHSFVHTGMPFHCLHCIKQYPSKHKLKVHIRTKHNIEATNEELETMRKVKPAKHSYTWTKVETSEG